MIADAILLVLIVSLFVGGCLLLWRETSAAWNEWRQR